LVLFFWVIDDPGLSAILRAIVLRARVEVARHELGAP